MSQENCVHDFKVVKTVQYNPEYIHITSMCKNCGAIDYYEGYPTKERIAKISKEKLLH